MSGLSLLRRVVDVRPAEVRALLWSFLYFLFLLAGYYMLRPIRDERGVAAGVGGLKWLYTAVFVVMLVIVPAWSALVSRVPRARLLPIVYRFFILNLLAFFVLFRLQIAWLTVARAFFVWISVFNLFVVAVFWGFMADLFRQEQGKRLFGFIAAGGSAGAIVGPLLTSLLVRHVGAANLLLLSALCLEGAAQCIGRLVRWHRTVGEGAPAPAAATDPEQAVGGGAFSGIKVVFASPYLLAVAGYVLLGAFGATFGYQLQARLVAAAALTQEARVQLFARIDLAVNVLAVVLQAGVSGRLLSRLGVGAVLALVPPLTTIGFVVLAVRPTLPVVSGLQVVRRALTFGLAIPAGNVLFTVVDREQKYKSKAFIDTVVWRLADVLGSWSVDALLSVGLAVRGAALVAVPLGALWMGIALFVGRRHQQLAGAPQSLR